MTSLYSSCGFMAFVALDTPSFSFKPNRKRKTGSGEDASGRGGDRGGDHPLCTPPFSCPFPSHTDMSWAHFCPPHSLSMTCHLFTTSGSLQNLLCFHLPLVWLLFDCNCSREHLDSEETEGAQMRKCLNTKSIFSVMFGALELPLQVDI